MLFVAAIDLTEEAVKLQLSGGETHRTPVRATGFPAPYERQGAVKWYRATQRGDLVELGGKILWNCVWMRMYAGVYRCMPLRCVLLCPGLSLNLNDSDVQASLKSIPRL